MHAYDSIKIIVCITMRSTPSPWPAWPGRPSKNFNLLTCYRLKKCGRVLAKKRWSALWDSLAEVSLISLIKLSSYLRVPYLGLAELLILCFIVV